MLGKDVVCFVAGGKSNLFDDAFLKLSYFSGFREGEIHYSIGLKRFVFALFKVCGHELKCSLTLRAKV